MIIIRTKNQKQKSKASTIVFGGAFLITAIILTYALAADKLSFGNDESTLYIPQAYINNDGGYTYASSPFTDVYQNTSDFYANDFSQPSFESGDTTVQPPDPSGWTTAQILALTTNAVNKTQAYTGDLSVIHSETFQADVTECTGGSVVEGVAETMIGWVVKPVQENLVYKNGRATNSEGESVPIILPKRNGFTLSANGIQSASIELSGSDYIVKIKLVEEHAGMYDVPVHNASAVGYLDVANFDLSFLEIDSADIIYKGTTIEFRISPEGYVTYAKYDIPLKINGSAHKGPVSGSATFEGVQSEEWIIMG